MKKLLMFLVLLTVSVGTWAYTGSGTNITLSEQEPGKQVITIAPDGAGALATWFAGLTTDQKNSFASETTRTNLVITGPMNAADIAVLNNTEWSKFVTVDLKGATVTSTDVLSLSMANVETVVLPSGYTKDEVNAAGAHFAEVNSNFGSCLSADGTIEPKDVTGLYYEFGGVEYEYTGQNGSAGQTINTNITVPLENAEGYPKYFYQNDCANNAQFEVSADKIVNGQVTLSEFPVVYRHWDSKYENPFTHELIEVNPTDSRIFTQNGDQFITVDFSPNSKTFNNIYGQYLYKYTDANSNTVTCDASGNQTTNPTNQASSNMQITLNNQSVTLYEKTTHVEVYNADKVVAYVNKAGSLYKATNLAELDATKIKTVVISGNVTVDDITQMPAERIDPLDTSLSPAPPTGEGKFTKGDANPAWYINNAGAAIKDMDLSSATIDNPVYLRTLSANSALERIVFPDNLTRIPYACCYANGNSGNNKLKDIVFPQGLREIGAYAFHDTAIEELYVTNQITTIGHEAFGTCQKLKDLEFQAGLTNLSFGGYVFDNCTGLKHITFPYGVKQIGNYIFNMCTALESIHLPNSLETIGDGAFHQCSKMRTLVIPESVRSIGKDAFGLCYFEDIFLMAETPDKLPTIYSTGAGFNSYDHGTFAGNQLHGNNTSPQQNYDLYATYTSKQMLQAYRDAVSGGNTIANLHYTPAVKEFIDVNPYYALYGAEKEYTEIKEGDQIIQPAGIGHESYYLSDTYLFVDKEQATWPSAYNNRNEPGTGVRLGMRGDGGFDGDYPRCSRVGDPTMYQDSDPDAWNYSPYATTDYDHPSILGWRQFVLRRGDANNEKVIIRKQYKDVWYTFCTPFDMSDEMLAIAFNEGFNICEFNAVEVEDANIILHFNSIAIEDKSRNALALAYHPYMIHPNYMTQEFDKQGITGVYQEEKHVSSSTRLCDGNEFNTLSQAVVKGASVELEGVSVSGNFYFIGNVDNPDEKVKEGTTRTVFSGDITDGKMIKTIQGGYEEGGDEVKLGDKLIPQYAYFLGTAPGEEYPRYWKETAPNDRASGGRWTQYSAIIISDQKIEKALGRNKPKEENPVKSLEIDFSEFNPEDVTAIEQIVEEAKANNVPVQYMNIVYDFNGNIVKKGDASLETLPEGMYIVNGKKYLVK